MIKIIEKWLKETIGVDINLDKDVLSKLSRDGVLLSQLLHYYGLFTENELLAIESSDNVEKIKENVSKIRRICEVISLENVTESDWNDLINERGNAALHIFYELFSLFQDKDRLMQMLRKVHQNSTSMPDNYLENQAVENNIFTSNFSCAVEKTRLEHKALAFQADKLILLKKKCDDAKQEYIMYLTKKMDEIFPKHSFKGCSENKISAARLNSTLDIDIKNLKLPDDDYNYTYAELIAQQQKAMQLQVITPSPKEAKKLINKLKVKRQMLGELNVFRKEFQTTLEDKLWKGIKKDQEKLLTKIVPDQMTTYSQQEKERLTSHLERAYEKEERYERFRKLYERLQEQRDQAFLGDLFAKVDKEDEYYKEKERILEEHRTLYAEKLRIDSEKRHEICRHILENILNVAINGPKTAAPLKEVPKNEPWRKLFTKKLPPIDQVSSFTNIAGYIKEFQRQQVQDFETDKLRQVLDENEFATFLQFKKNWDMSNVTNEERILKLLNCGLNILGHYVHTFLNTKYPEVKNEVNAHSMNFKYTCCIGGLLDMSIISQLQTLLKNFKIKIIQKEDVIQYCIDAYNKEIRIEVDKVESEEILCEVEAVPVEKAKPPKKATSKKSTTKGTNKPDVNQTEVTTEEKHDKEVQTPRIFPGQIVVLTHVGRLGELAAEQLLEKEGNLNDYLFVEMLIEYLKNLLDTEGWVLINYPLSYQQAIILEDTYVGRYSLPLDGSCSITTLKEDEIMETKSKRGRRQSKIVPNPLPLPEDGEIGFKSILQSYIVVDEYSYDSAMNLDDGDNLFIARSSENTANPLNRLYIEQGNFYLFRFKIASIDTVKNLARVILNETEIPRKLSAELFGSTLQELDDVLTIKSAKASTGKKATAKTSDKNFKIAKKSKEKIVEEPESATKSSSMKLRKQRSSVTNSNKKLVDTETQFPEVYEGQPSIPSINPEENIIPGEPGWSFLDHSLPEQYQVMLGSFWEKTENEYIQSMRDVFYHRRTYLSSFWPYISFLKVYLTEFVERADSRQMYLTRFQYAFDAIPPEERKPYDNQSVLYCRLDELRGRLLNITDSKMSGSINERKIIMREKWVSNQIAQVAKVYLRAYKSNIQRYINSLQFLMNYYYAVITNSYDQVPILSEPDSINTNIHVKLNKIVEDSGEKLEIEQFLNFVQLNMEKILIRIANLKYQTLDVVQRIENYFIRKCTNAKGPMPAGQYIKFYPTPLVQDNFERIIREWRTAIHGETFRVSVRVKLIAHDWKFRFTDVARRLNLVLDDVYNKIDRKYSSEIAFVKNLKKFITTAIEEERPLSKPLTVDMTFDEDLSKKVSIADSIPPSHTPNKCYFDADSLKILHVLFINLSQGNFIHSVILRYLLQDVVINDIDQPPGEKRLTPICWHKLSPIDVDDLIDDIFGIGPMIYWKDFFIYLLPISIPTEAELLKMRKQFVGFDPFKSEVVSKEDYNKIKFWFEPHSADAEDLKRLFFNMFLTSEDTINYTSFLFDLCKDDDPVQGFAKALELTIGELVCWDKAVGEKYVETMKTKRLQHEMDVKQREHVLFEYREMARQILEDVVDATVTKSTDGNKKEEDKKQKRGKGAAAKKQPKERHKKTSIDEDDNKSYKINISIESRNSSRKSVESGEKLNKIKEVDDQSDQSIRTNKTGSVIEPDSLRLRKAKHFCNVDVGFEPNFDPVLTFFIEKEPIISVFNAAFSRVENNEELKKKCLEQIDEIFTECENEFFNNKVLVHEILNCEQFINLLHNSERFNIKAVDQSVHTIANIDRPCGFCR